MNSEEANNLLIEAFVNNFEKEYPNHETLIEESVLNEKILNSYSNSPDIIIWSLIDPSRYKRILLCDLLQESYDDRQCHNIFGHMTFVPPLESIHLIIDGDRFVLDKFIKMLFISSYITENYEILTWIINNYMSDLMCDSDWDNTQYNTCFKNLVYDCLNNTHENICGLLKMRCYSRVVTSDIDATYKLFMNLVRKYDIDVDKFDDEIKVIMHDRYDYTGSVENVYYNIYHNLRKIDYLKIPGDIMHVGIFVGPNALMSRFLTRTDSKMNLADMLLLKVLHKVGL